MNEAQSTPSTSVTRFFDREFLRLELGCGPRKRYPDSVGVDVLGLPGVDVVGEAMSVLAELPAASVDEIHSEHFLEHIEDPRALLAEAARVIKPGGVFRAVIPHYSNPWFYSDPTHRSFFGLYTFSYWVHDDRHRRKVPHYDELLPFDLESVRMVFMSSRPFYVRHGIKKVLSSWVNLGRWTQEFYEENVSTLLPCYELDYTLVRRPE